VSSFDIFKIDYSIRRIEFDSWLLERSGATINTHQVKTIEQQKDHYVIDGKYECKYLVGAGGTGCPVRRIFFPNQRVKKQEIVALEKELEYPQRDDTTYLFFFEHGLKGYSWYVPKGNGYVNIGLGGFSFYFEKSGINIHTHFQWFLENLVKRGLLDPQTAQQLKPGGYAYYLFTKEENVKKNNCFLIGDSAGLATIDLGEGISPSIKSGLLVADEIMGTSQYNKTAISSISMNRFVEWIIEPLLFKVLGIR
jgi:flavin-dependent dehydrogenase